MNQGKNTDKLGNKIVINKKTRLHAACCGNYSPKAEMLCTNPPGCVGNSLFVKIHKTLSIISKQVLVPRVFLASLNNLSNHIHMNPVELS
jgi:hypothetical protein